MDGSDLDKNEDIERATLRESLSRTLPEIPPRYFYDDVGSALFERITELPVYYQTRTEIAILERFAGDILAAALPSHIVEIGSGAGRKIRLLFDAWATTPRSGAICTMLDINELFLTESIERLSTDYPDYQFRAVVGDFVHDLHRLGPPGGRMIVFFGGTIGNLYPNERNVFLKQLADGMDTTDTFLLGVDLVKDTARLEAAYDDVEGVTAAFNKNMLVVLNRRFGGDFNPDHFRHRAFYDVENAWIEMRLVAERATSAKIRDVGATLVFQESDEIRTEISCKFTRETVLASALAAGLTIEGWYSDPENLFALALLRKQG